MMYEDLWQYDVSDDIISGNTKNLQIQMDKGWNINEPIRKYYFQGIVKYPIMLAIQYNNMSSVYYLLQQGAVLDIDEYHAFLVAIRYADETIIRYVVEQGAKVKVNTPVLNAYDFIAQRKKLHLFPLMKELGLEIEPYGQHAFFREIDCNNYDVVELFIEEGINLNYCKKTDWNGYGNTPLCHAATYCDPKMLEYLIRHGADPTMGNKAGKRPYLLALQQGKIENARFLKQFEPHCDGPDERLVKKLPNDLLEFLRKGNLRLELPDVIGIKYIEFLPLEDLSMIDFNGRKGILLTREVENYPDICLLWNTKKKCVSYYEEEHRWYGDFDVSFQQFIDQIERYMNGIFTYEFAVQ